MTNGVLRSKQPPPRVPATAASRRVRVIVARIHVSVKAHRATRSTTFLPFPVN